MTSNQTPPPSRPRRRILATATRLFLEDGIQAVGIDRISAEANVALMTLYRHFGGKDELVAAALEQWSAQWLTSLTDRLDQCGDDPRARFTGLWDALVDWLHSEEFRGSFVANAATELRSKPNHPVHEVVAAHRMAMRQLLEDLAKLEGVADPAALAEQLRILVEGLVVVRPVDAAGVRVLANAALAVAVAG
jgi:AcrR family transcriptional regulator